MDWPEPGHILASRYELVSPLARGGAGEVWLANDVEADRQVALKHLPGLSPAAAAEALEAERSAAAAVVHPAVVAMEAVVRDGDRVFAVMEYLDGDELTRYAGADYRRVLPLLRPAVDALAQAHERGVVHGDVKAENVLIGADGRGRLVDFGAVGGGGSPHTMSPQRRAGDAPAPADDVYALAATIHELLTGTPPEADAADGEAPAFRPRHPAPPALASLLRRMLDTDAAQRPPMAEVAREIDAVLRAGATPADGEGDFERIAPVRRVRATPAEAPKRSPVAAIVALALAGTLALAGAAFWLVPRLADRLADGDAGAEDGVSAAETAVREAGERLEAQREAADTARRGVVEKWMRLESMNVTSWAELRFQRAMDLNADADRQYSDGDFLAAGRSLRGADELLAAILRDAPDVAATARELGMNAFEMGDAQTAATQFQIAAAIDPDDVEARDMLERTIALPAVLDLLREARRHEVDGDLRGALERYARAAEYDPRNDEAVSGERRLRQRIADEAFASTMSGAIAAIEAGNFARARSLLGQAAAQRPDADEVADARTLLATTEREQRITTLRRRAETAEAAERWDDAIAAYDQLLNVDETLVFAQRGLQRSRRVASTITQIEALLAEPNVLVPARAQQRAEALLARAEADGASSRVAELRVRLDEALRLVRTPVSVRLVSDNQTEVTVYRVGRLGAFDSRELSLYPGTYTAVGTREGFRDVRHEFTVFAGEAPPAQVIQCEERI